jgi:hypothetical protein
LIRNYCDGVEIWACKRNKNIARVQMLLGATRN